MSKNSGHTELEFIHEHHIAWYGEDARYSIMGQLSMDLSSCRVSLHIEKEGYRKERIKLDLYDYDQVTRHVEHLSNQGFDYGKLENDLMRLTQLLEAYREGILKEHSAHNKPRTERRLSLEREKEIIHLLKQDNLLDYINEGLGKIGIAGEEDNRLLLFIIGSSYKHKPLHAVIQSSSGSGKSHLINTIAGCFPDEDVLSLSRVTSKSLYHVKGDTLQNKLVLIQDFDGLDDEALYAFRELQSYGKLTTSMTGKDVFGNHTAKLHTVVGHFSSFGATTREMYMDNQSRSIVLSMDESSEQTERIIQAIPPEPARMAKIQTELKNMIRMLKPRRIINPFARDLVLPGTVPMARRLNDQLKRFVEQITYLHQYGREEDEQGRIITQLSDVQAGLRLFSDSLALKLDELTPQARSFYESLKEHWSKQEDDFAMNQRMMRETFGISKTSLQRHIKLLLELEYLTIHSGTKNKGYYYTLEKGIPAQHNTIIDALHKRILRA